MKHKPIKFEFGTDFQLDVLKLTLLDKLGYRALTYYDDSYFELIEHGIIAKSIELFFKKYKRIPSESLLLDQTTSLLKGSDYKDLITKEDEEDVLKLIKKIFRSKIKQGDIVLDKLSQFRSYIELKHVVENVDLINYESYSNFANQVKKAITDPLKIADLEGKFLVRDLQERQSERAIRNPIVPLPYKQLNDLTNANGYAKGAIIVILDKPKKAKTATLVNIAKQLMKQRRSVLYIDLENGDDEILMRLEQSMTNRNKREILSGEYNKDVMKTFRRYNRMGAELIVKEFPSYTTADDVAAFMDFMYQEHGIRFDDIVVDYLALMGSTKVDNRDEFHRISSAYMEMRDMAKERNINHVHTAHHVKRNQDETKREKTSYIRDEIAKCIDIVRHVQMIIGLNRTEEEEAAGYQRLEIVEQRDGPSNGHAVMHFNQKTQNMKELSKKELGDFERIFSHIFTGESPEEEAKAEEHYKNSKKKGDDI